MWNELGADLELRASAMGQSKRGRRESKGDSHKLLYTSTATRITGAEQVVYRMQVSAEAGENAVGLYYCFNLLLR